LIEADEQEGAQGAPERAGRQAGPIGRPIGQLHLECALGDLDLEA
jgi:hypothetical protein